MEIYFNYYFANHFATFLIIILSIIFISLIKKKDPATKYFLLYLIFFMTIPLGYAIWNTFIIHKKLMILAPFINLFIFLGVFYLLFAYNYIENFHKKETKIAAYIFTFLSIIAYFHFSYLYAGYEYFFNFDTHLTLAIDESESHQIFDPVFMVIIIWIIVVQVRKIIIFFPV